MPRISAPVLTMIPILYCITGEDVSIIVTDEPKEDGEEHHQQTAIFAGKYIFGFKSI